MSVVFSFLFKKIAKLVYLNTEIFFYIQEIKSGPDEVSGMGLFVTIVNRSITLLFSQEVPSWELEYASSVSVTAISWMYGCL